MVDTRIAVIERLEERMDGKKLEVRMKVIVCMTEKTGC